MTIARRRKISRTSIGRRRFFRRSGDSLPPVNTWILSFTDVMALMLTFFVMMFAMSHPKEEAWEDFADTIKTNFSKFDGPSAFRGPEEDIQIDQINFNQALDLSYLKAIMGVLLKEEPSLSRVQMIEQPGALILSLPDDILFEPGQADVRAGSDKALYALAGSLSRIQNRIEVVGHADPRPVTGGAFSSNWDLSLARAAHVAAVLENVGYDSPITIRGASSGRYRDLSTHIPEELRLSLSRRVDIVIMEDDGSTIKLFDIQ